MRAKLLVSVAAGVLLVGSAACSSSGGTGSGSTGGASTSAAGTPISIMGTSAFSGQSSPYPEVLNALKAAVAAVNASGGVNGHPLKLATCDNQGDPNQAQSCAQQAVDDHVVAVIAPSNFEATSMLPTLAKAGIPFIGNSVQTPADATSPVSFPFGPGAFNLSQAGGSIAKQLGCSKVGGVIVQAPNITEFLTKTVQGSVAAAGLRYTGSLYASLTQTNYTSTVAALEQAGDDCAVLAINQPQTTGFLTSWKQSGSKMEIIFPGGVLASLSKIGSIADGTYAYSAFRLPGDPKVAAAESGLKKYGGSDITISGTALAAWGDIKVLVDALSTVTGTPTAASVLKAMNDLRDAQSDNVYPTLTVAGAKTDPQAPRIFTNEVITYQVKGTSFMPMGDFHDIGA